MRATSSLLANVKAARYLAPGTPTGLTGLLTARSPRPALIYLYSSTLETLKQIPESSVYRQSVEALTKQRLQIVQAQVPAGYDSWREKVEKLFAERPDILERYSQSITRTADGQPIVLDNGREERDVRDVEWDGEHTQESRPEMRRNRWNLLNRGQTDSADERKLSIEAEPDLTAEQISQIEEQIGAGLIEEVIDVAAGERDLLFAMIEAKPWEELIEKPAEGQWSYFERGAGTHTGTTQKPPA